MSQPAKVKNLTQQFEKTTAKTEEKPTFDFPTIGRNRPRHSSDASGSLFERDECSTGGAMNTKLNDELAKRFSTDQGKSLGASTVTGKSADAAQAKLRKQQPKENLVLRRTALFEDNETSNHDQPHELRNSLSPKSEEIIARGIVTKNKRQLAQDRKSDAISKIGEHIAQLRIRPVESKPAPDTRFSYENVFPAASYVNSKDPKSPAGTVANKPAIPAKPCKPPSPVVRDGKDLIRDKKSVNMEESSGIKKSVTHDKPSESKNSAGLHNVSSANKKEENADSAVSVLSSVKKFEQSPEKSEDDHVKPHVHILPERVPSSCRDSNLLKNLESVVETQSGMSKPVAPPKPCKPPRTFQHDDYVKTKAEKSKTAPSMKKSSVVFHKYEDIPNASSTLGPVHKYEEIPDPALGPINKTVKPPKPCRPPTLPRRPSTGLNQPTASTSSCESIKEALDKEEKAASFGFRTIRARKDVREEWTPRLLNSPKKSKKQSSLRRTLSDECLYMDAGKMLADISKEPVYHDPGMIPTLSYHGNDSDKSAFVEIDSEGYAVPEIGTRGHRQVQRTTTNPELGFKQKIAGLKHFFADGMKQPENKKKTAPVKQKISRAFSVLRKVVKHERGRSANTNIEEDEEEDDDSGEDNLDGVSVDSESIVDEEEQKKRLKYVASVREKNYMTLEMARKNRDKIYPQLFEYALVVGLRPKPTNLDVYEPYTMHKFPPQVKDDNEAIPQFCFPDASDWKPVPAYNSETFSFVLTNIDGTRLYGYCLRVLPSGIKPRLPEVYCIISPLDAHGLYLQVLDEIERRRINVTYEYALEFIAASYSRPLPSSGKYIHVKTNTRTGQPDVLTLKRESDFRLEDVDLETVLQKLGIETLLEVYASLLLERRILFTANKLSTLSACVHSLVSLLYPFTWQHTFIPVLPTNLIDIVCSPTPYIIGILSSCQDQLADLPMEEVLVIDIDKGELLQSMGDEDTIIPKKLQKALKMAIKDEGDSVCRNLVISEAFMRLFVETVGHYADFINVQQNGEKVFQRESFIKMLRSKSMRMFVEWFCETQMFEVFMSDILESAPDAYKVLFEARIVEYQEEMSGDKFKDNVKEFGKKMKNFGKAIKHKFKDGKS